MLPAIPLNHFENNIFLLSSHSQKFTKVQIFLILAVDVVSG